MNVRCTTEDTQPYMSYSTETVVTWESLDTTTTTTCTLKMDMFTRNRRTKERTNGHDYRRVVLFMDGGARMYLFSVPCHTRNNNNSPCMSESTCLDLPEIRLIRILRRGTGSLKPELGNRVPSRLHFCLLPVLCFVSRGDMTTTTTPKTFPRNHINFPDTTTNPSLQAVNDRQSYLP